MKIFEQIRATRKVCWDIEKQSEQYRFDLMNWETRYISRQLSIWVTYLIKHSSAMLP